MTLDHRVILLPLSVCYIAVLPKKCITSIGVYLCNFYQVSGVHLLPTPYEDSTSPHTVLSMLLLLRRWRPRRGKCACARTCTCGGTGGCGRARIGRRECGRMCAGVGTRTGVGACTGVGAGGGGRAR